MPEQESILCACGCGRLLDRYDKRGRPRRFIHNHHSKLQPSKRVYVKCENCGKDLLRPDWHRKQVSHHFCDHKCEGEWSTKVGRRRGHNNGHYNTITVACSGCGAPVTRAASLINRRSGRAYCAKCIHLIRKGRPGFYVGYPSEFNATLRERVRKRDNHICQNCGKPQSEVGTLHVHHIDYDKSHSDSGNLISLCRHCHGLTQFGTDAWAKKFQTIMSRKGG